MSLYNGYFAEGFGLDPYGYGVWDCVKALFCCGVEGAWQFVEGTAGFAWDLVWSPKQTVSGMIDGIKALKNAIQRGDLGQAAQQLAPEIHELITKWDQLNDYDRCCLIAKVIGEYGMGVLTGAGIAKMVGKMRSARRARSADYTADISPGRTRATSRSGHTNQGNKQVFEDMMNDPELLRRLEEMYPGIVDRTSTRNGGRRNPIDRDGNTAEWDHDPYNQHRLYLLRKDVHDGFTGTDPGRIGGYSRFWRENAPGMWPYYRTAMWRGAAVTFGERTLTHVRTPPTIDSYSNNSYYYNRRSSFSPSSSPRRSTLR